MREMHGTVTLQGNTTILDGAIGARALKGFQGGTVSLSGSDVVVQASTVPLPSGFDFNSAVPERPHRDPPYSRIGHFRTRVQGD